MAPCLAAANPARVRQHPSGALQGRTVYTYYCDAGTYLVTWNGHGDALVLWRENADGTLTLANSYTYGTWGRPTTATHNGIGDLGFRFLYVGEFDVQWDDQFGVGLLYMHARHYSPSLGRFVQPDPIAVEANLYAYVSNSPATRSDPAGKFCFVPIIGQAICIELGKAATVAAISALAWAAGQIGAHLYAHPPRIVAPSGTPYILSKQDKKLTSDDIKVLKRKGINPEELKDHNAGLDLWKRPNGDVVIKPKSGRGPGEPTGVNLRNLIFGNSYLNKLLRTWGF